MSIFLCSPWWEMKKNERYWGDENMGFRLENKRKII